jgi:Glycosyltransferase
MNFDFSKTPGRRLLNRNLNTHERAVVSIITPYYNAGKYFNQTYNCVMNQTFPWYEWIIVDDGSTNNEDIEILLHLAKKDKRIRLLKKENGGIATARNLAIKNSTTDIIVPLDADDLIAPTYVEKIYWSLHFNEDYSWSYTKNIGFHNQEYLWDKPFDANLIRSYNFLTYSAGIRKKVIEEVGFYDEITKHYYEDWRLWLKLLSKSKKPIKLDVYEFWYRRLDSGVLSIVNKDKNTKELAQHLIDEVAVTVNTNILGKEYPSIQVHEQYIQPKMSDWKLKVFDQKNKINVMFLIPWLEMGGADQFNLEVVRNINKSEFEISIITTNSSQNSWKQEFEEYVTDIFELPSFLDVKDYPEFISYFINSREIDIIFLSNSYYGYYIIPWLKKEFPKISIVDYVHMEEWYWRKGGFARTSGALSEFLDKTYVCNNKTRNVLIEKFGRNQLSVDTLYIGVDVDKYNENNVKEGIAKSALNIASNRPLVLYPCRIHPQKRPFLMLEIAVMVKKNISDIAFVVVGDGPQLEEIKAKTVDLELSDTIYYAGRQNDMVPFYRDADLTLICSIKEGLALTAYESLAMGKPVVTSDVGGQSELIDNSVGRILPLLQNEEELDDRMFKNEEIKQYSDAIIDIIQNKGKYSIACRKRIEDNFSLNITIKKLESIFYQLIYDVDLLANRDKLSEKIIYFPNLINDHIVIYNELEAIREEGERVWAAKEWFRKLYEDRIIEKKDSNNVIPQDINEAQMRLLEIYNMRSWKLISKYQNFMHKTYVGKWLLKLRHLLKNK